MKVATAIFAFLFLQAVFCRAELGEGTRSPLEMQGSSFSPRSKALEVASSGPAAGFHTRDGFWSGVLEKQSPVFIQVHLFEGNEYRFTAANLDPATRISVSILDAWGNHVGHDALSEPSAASAGIYAAYSGKYLVCLTMTEGDKADTCMVYSYK